MGSTHWLWFCLCCRAFSVQSFRFGPEIAYVGSTILDVCKGIRNKTLLGGTQKGELGLGIPGRFPKITVFWDANRDLVILLNNGIH